MAKVDYVLEPLLRFPPWQK